jgi:hypothetical protein
MQEQQQSTEQRSRKKRKDIGPQVTPRDLAALQWIGEQYATRLDQLQTVLGRLSTRATKQPGKIAETTARHAIVRWESLGLAESRKILHDQPPWVWLTPLGLRSAGLEFPAWRPGPDTLSHIYWCNQARLYITQRRPEATWESERYLRLALGTLGAKGKPPQQTMAKQTPDALLHTPNGLLAIEVELSAKERQRMARVIRQLVYQYTQAPLNGTVWYFVSPAARSGVEAALRDLDPEARRHIVVYGLSKLTEE